jgi:DNA-binding PadR family transcriptional regulator
MKEYVLPPLTPAVFYILLALTRKERHGYDIMRQVARDSEGLVTIGSGTLYGSIKRMIDDNLIQATSVAPDRQKKGRSVNTIDLLPTANKF